MKPEFVDCFMLIGTALSLNHNHKLPEMGRPYLSKMATTQVNLSLSLQEIHFTNSHSMQVEITTLLHQRWIDPRLGANVQTRKLATAGQIWRPKITILKGDRWCNDNEDTQFWRGFGDEGNILLSEKVTIKTYCTQKFEKFPFDSQVCELKFGTYRFPIDEVELQWHPEPVEILIATNLNEFELINVTVFHEVDIRPSGNFSVSVVHLTVTRYCWHYILCYMVPCSFLVMLSYISFWIDCKNMSLRLTFSFIIVIMLLYFYKIASCSTLAAQYLKSLDVFIVMCLTFAVLALLENCSIMQLFAKTYLSYDGKGMGPEQCSLKWIETGVKIIFPFLYIISVILYLYHNL